LKTDFKIWDIKFVKEGLDERNLAGRFARNTNKRGNWRGGIEGEIAFKRSGVRSPSAPPNKIRG